jgi:hypothetical protein
MSTPGVRRAAAEAQRDQRPQGAPICWVEQATVASVTAGGAKDGNALCQITWRGSVAAAAYAAGYTPTAGDVVLVLVQLPQLVIIDRVIGTP